MRSKSAGRPRSWGKILFLVVLCVVFLLVGGVAGVWWWGGAWLADQISQRVSEGPFKSTHSRLEVEHVGGVPWRTLVFGNVAWKVEGDEGSEITFLSADRLTVHVNPLRLLGGDFTFDRVEAEGLALNLEPRGSTFITPDFGGGEDSNAETSSPLRLAIHELIASRSSLFLGVPDLPLSFTHMDADLEFRLDEVGLRITPRELAADLNDSLGRLTVNQGSILIGGDAAARLDSLGGSLGENPLTVFLDENNRGVPELRLVSENIPGKLIQDLTQLENLEPGFVRSGDVTFELGDELVMWGTVEGTWEHYELKNVDFRSVTDASAFRTTVRRADVWGGTVSHADIVVPHEGLEMTVDAVFENLRLEAICRDLEAEPVAGEISGKTSIFFPDRNVADLDHRVQVNLNRGHILEVPFETVEGFATGGVERGYRILDAHVALGEGYFETTGHVGTELIDVDVEFFGNLRPLRRMIPVEDLDGEGDLSATIFGPPDSLVISAAGSVRNFSGMNTFIPMIDIHKARGPIVEGRHLELGFTISDPFEVGGAVVDTVLGDVLVKEDGAHLTRLHASKGDTTLDVTGSLTWEPVTRAALETAVARVGSRIFTLTKPAVVTYDEGLIAADSLSLETLHGDFVAKGSYDQNTQWLEVTFDLHDLDPLAVVPQSYLGAASLSRIDGFLSLSGQIPVLDGVARVSMHDFRYEDFKVDSLSTSLSVQGPVIEVDHFWASRGRGRVTASGDVILAGPLYTVLEREVFGPDIPGWQTLWNVDFETENIYLEEWFFFLLPSVRPRGQVTSTLSVRGNSLHPEIQFWTVADQVSVHGFQADHLSTRLNYDDGVVTIDSLNVWLDDVPVRISGTLPMDLSFKPFVAQVPERPMDLVVDSRGGSLRNLSVTPWIHQAGGTFTGHVELTGTPRDPILVGEMNAQADTVIIQDRDDVLRNASVWLTLEDKVINVVAADGDLGGGRVTARGTYSPFAREEDSYSLVLTLNKAVVRESGLYAARVSGELTLEPRIVEGTVYPFATGDLFVHRAEYIGPIEGQDVSTPQATNFIYDVSINAPSQLIVQSRDFKGELSANIRVIQSPRRMELQGVMEVLEGEFYTPTAKFTMKDGTMTWSDPTTILPELDMSLETLSGGYIIELDVTGRTDEIDYTFSAYDPDTGENAGLSTEEIYRQLFLLGSGHLTTGTIMATQIWFRQDLDQLLNRTDLIDDLAIDPTYDETGDVSYRVSVRKFLTPELSLRFGQELSRYFDPNFALEYRLGRAFFLRGETLRERALDASSVTTRYQVDVSARRDY